MILSDYAVLKVEDNEFQKLDQRYVIGWKKETFGYCCLTNQNQYNIDNNPGMVIEKCGIDDLILVMTGGK